MGELSAEAKSAEFGLNPLSVVGLELKIALQIIGNRSDAKSADNEFWIRKCSVLLSRPAIEPILLINWGRLKQFEMSQAHISGFCSRITGSELRSRTGESYGLWNGGDVRFEHAAVACHWWEDIKVVANNPKIHSLLPVYCYARTIIAHPFRNGNGRLARAMLLASLAREGNLQAPTIALAPAFYKNAAAIADGLRALSRNGDWGAMTLILVRVLKEAMEMSRSGWKIKN